VDANAERNLFVVHGILFRAIEELRKSPKPWNSQTKRAVKLLAQARGIAHDSWEALDGDTRKAIVRSVGTPNTRKDPMAGTHAGGNDGGTQYKLFHEPDASGR